MRRPAAVALVALACVGCYSPINELVATHISAGGAVSASLDAGAAVTTKAIADGTADPMTVEGTSAFLVFGLIIGDDDLTGSPAKAQLLGGHGVQMTVSPTTRSQLSVHLDGRSCAATAAVIHLTPDGNGHLDGDFSGTGEGCQMAGTVAAVPVDQ